MNALWEIIQTRGGGVTIEIARSLLGEKVFTIQTEQLVEKDIACWLYTDPAHPDKATHIYIGSWGADWVIKNLLNPILADIKAKSRNR